MLGDVTVTNRACDVSEEVVAQEAGWIMVSVKGGGHCSRATYTFGQIEKDLIHTADSQRLYEKLRVAEPLTGGLDIRRMRSITFCTCAPVYLLLYIYL